MDNTIKVYFGLSVLFNLAFVLLGTIWLIKKGGLSYLLRKLSSQKSDPLYSSPYYQDRKGHFETLVKTDESIIFLGDSLTDSCEWSEILGCKNIKNRGISGDRTDGVLNRLDEVLSFQARKIFIMIGINDLVQGKKIEDVLKNYKSILEKLKQSNPDTKIFVQSVLPINNQKAIDIQDLNLNNGKVVKFNQKLQELAQEFSVQYLDLFPTFADENNQLDERYTTDGVHLNGQAYSVWRGIIEKYVVN